MSDDPGIEIIVRDLATGESESKTVVDDYVIVTAGACHLDGVQAYPKVGTHVLTVKGVKR